MFVCLCVCACTCTNNTYYYNKHYSVRLPVINIWLIVLCAYGQSIFVFIIYGLRSDVYEQWHTAIVTRSLRPAEKQPTVLNGRTTVGGSKHKMYMNGSTKSAAADKQQAAAAAAVLSAILVDMEKQDVQQYDNNGSPKVSDSQLPTPTSPELPDTALFKSDQTGSSAQS
jgi:hypothetical protein